MELAYAALQQLCSPILELIDRLPEPQRDALGVAFGLSAGQAPSPFLVGLAVLGLCPRRRRSSRCCASSTTRSGSIARRRERSRLWRAACWPSGSRSCSRRVTLDDGSAGFPQLRVEPLGRRDARTLLESVLPARLDESVLERIVAETRGNPLALLELPRGLTPAQLAGGFGLPAALPLSDQDRGELHTRLAPLPRDARRLAALAAADPVGDPALCGGGAAARDPRDGCATPSSRRAC